MDPYSVTGLIVGVMVVVLAAGLLAGQFRRGVVQELRAALDTAAGEISIQKGRADRLDGMVAQMQIQITALLARPDWSKVVEVVGGTEVNIIAEFRRMIGEHEAREFEAAANAEERQTNAAKQLVADQARIAESVAKVATDAAAALGRTTMQTATDLESARAERAK